MTTTIADTWDELVTAALLGTDRRDPPELPVGPLADTVADALRPTPQGRLLAAVAATTVARRSGATPLPPLPVLQPPEPDRRPMLPTAAVERWVAIVAEWPVLEAEWLAVAAASGWRPAADVLVGLLRRHRRSRVLADAVLAWGGPLAAWLVDNVPDLGPVDARPLPPGAAARALPVPARLEPLLDGPAEPLAAALAEGLTSGEYRWSHRAVLLNVVARVQPTSLTDIVTTLSGGRDALGAEAADVAPLALWEALIELALVRRAMLHELRPSNGETG
jgi:hypothetical protein